MANPRTALRRDRQPAGIPTVATAKTSAAAALALVFGLSAFYGGLTVPPLAILFGLIGLVLGIVGRKKTREAHITGAGLATAGIALSVVGLLVGIALTAALVTFITNPDNLRELQGIREDLRTIRNR